MKMATQKTVNPNFAIDVTVQYVDSESKPDMGYYFFTYRIRIENKDNTTAQLMSRHWIITDAHGQTEEVRGAGVVGLQPKIHAGKIFEYESACPLPTPSGSMRGFYQLTTDAGETFDIEIPEFYLISPSALH